MEDLGMLATWLLLGVMVLAPTMWLILLVIGWLRTNELRAAIQALQAESEEGSA
jgi:hypothetical protein